MFTVAMNTVHLHFADEGKQRMIPALSVTSGKPRLTHVANSASGTHAVGLGRVEASNKTGGEKKETLALIKIHM